MNYRNWVILIVLTLICTSSFAFGGAPASEVYRAVANAQCAKFSQTTCETEQNNGLVSGNESFDCRWNEQVNGCRAINFEFTRRQ